MTSINSAVSEFILSCQAEGLADSTIRWYRSILTRFAERHAHVPLHQVTPHEMREYLAGMRKLEYSPDSVDDYTRALHRFWKWAILEHEGLRNPMRSMKYPQTPKPKQPKAAELSDVIAMFRAAEGSTSTVRDQAILAFTLDTGCRAGGVCSVRVADVDMERRKAIVTEKGSKTRSVVFTKVTAVLLHRWIEHRQDVEVLFYNLHTWEPLRPNGLLQLFKRLGRRAKVTGHSNPHSFRHTFGKEYVKAGGDVITLARIMGHESVDTTADHYAVFTNDEIAVAHEKYSPINLLFKGEKDE